MKCKRLFFEVMVENVAEKLISIIDPKTIIVYKVEGSSPAAIAGGREGEIGGKS
jgi:hypothetical protein